MKWYVNSPNNFCYVCGVFLTADITTHKINVKLTYGAYFRMKLGDQEKAWAQLFVRQLPINLRRLVSRIKKKNAFCYLQDLARAKRSYIGLLLLFS